MSIAIKSMLRYTIALIVLVAFVCAIWIVGRDGLSSLAAKSAMDHALLSSAEKAISLNPKNPEAYYARASLYRKNGHASEAIKDLERSVELKPGDYFLRLELGFTRYQAGDITGATEDFEASVRLAPYYAQPRWYLGNMLLQAGRLDEGFAELRRAVKSDPVYLLQLIQRADEALDGDPGAMVKAVGTESSENRLALERYFIQHDNIPAAMELFRAGKGIPSEELRSLLSDLLAAKRFTDAYEVWRAGKEIPARMETENAILDGGFEGAIDPEAVGFEWQLAKLEKLRVARDSTQFQSGAFSLRVDYDGNSSPSSRVISQLVPVEANKEYRLSFAAQTTDMVTGGLPLITITDATDGHLLAQSPSLPGGTNSWRTYEFNCRTAPTTRAVIIAIQRSNCSSSPCPAFGRAWFDSFNWQVN